MRVYYEGNPIAMKYVRWGLLCSAKTYVDFNEDTDVDWPDHVIQDREKAIKKLSTMFIPKERIKI